MSRKATPQESEREKLYAELRRMYDNADAIIRWLERLNPP